MALALLNLAWWLSVRETDVFFFFVGEPSLLPSGKIERGSFEVKLAQAEWLTLDLASFF